jgi:hypothetical protein
MATITYENVTPTPIENAVVQKVLRDGVHKTYYITPVDGYVLHDKNYDDINVTPVLLGYRTSTASIPVSYDFAANPREFYAVPADSVPAN